MRDLIFFWGGGSLLGGRSLGVLLKRVLAVSVPLVLVAGVAVVAIGNIQANELKSQCRFSTINLAVLHDTAQVGQAEVRLYGGAGRFDDGGTLTEARTNLREVERFPALVDSHWLAKIVGIQPQNLDFWRSASDAANSFVEQLEYSANSGDYSGAANFGDEVISVYQQVTIDSDECLF